MITLWLEQGKNSKDACAKEAKRELPVCFYLDICTPQVNVKSPLVILIEVQNTCTSELLYIYIWA